ncbi:MAG: S1 RNA-binding domain-containing protein, partial [Proteobacteria bacterium]|nr:S1 RNA-binding domain-containing protein [Pseudomonadota bacterium]
MKVYTNMDLQFQIYAQHALINGLYAHDKRQGYRGTLGNLWDEVNQEQNLSLFDPERGWDPESFAILPPEMQQLALDNYQEKQTLITLKNHYIIGGNLKGVVVKVNKTIANVDIGDFQGRLNLDSLRWARPVDYTTVNDHNTRLKDLRDILKIGDIIELKILDYDQTEQEFSLELTQKPMANGGLVSIDPGSGQVYAMSGGFDFRDSEFNRAVQSKRQPGSAF